jgi:transposase
VEVFQGNTADPATLAIQLNTLRDRISISRVVVVGDRGLLTDARIGEELRPTDFGWITVPEPYPGERLVVCRNPLLAEKRKRERLAMMANTEKELDKVVAATRREQWHLTGKDKIAVRADRALRRYRVGRHFETTITDEGLSWRRNEASIAAETAIDGIYILGTNLAGEELSAEETVRSYKRLNRIEQAFRSHKTVDLKVRSVHHHLEGQVRAHVFLCMLAYYVEWQMHKALAPLLFDDDDPGRGRRLSSGPTGPSLPRRTRQGRRQTHSRQPSRP